jgi:hypothetical protein
MLLGETLVRLFDLVTGVRIDWKRIPGNLRSVEEFTR